MDFFLKYKKVFFLAVFLLVVFLLGYLLYFVFFKPALTGKPPVAPAGTSTIGQFPAAGTGTGGIISDPGAAGQKLPPAEPAADISDVALGGLTRTKPLSDKKSLDATLAANGSDLQYYDKGDGKFYRITKDGEAVLLSDKVFHEAEKVTWAPNKNKVIIEYPDGANIIYDFDGKKQTTLPSHWEDFAFSPSGNQIVMKSIGLDPNNRWLAVADIDNSESRIIEPLGDNESSVYPAWSPNNQVVALFTEGVDFDRQEVYFVGANKENFKSTVVEGRGFQPKWSPEGNRLLYSVYSGASDMKPNLWIVDAEGENIGANRKNLHLATWADKCVYADNNGLYCAVPENLEEGAGLFPEMARTTKDALFRIDTDSGLKKIVAIPDGDFSMSNLIVSDNGYYLYFTDDKTGRLHQVRLK